MFIKQIYFLFYFPNKLGIYGSLSQNSMWIVWCFNILHWSNFGKLRIWFICISGSLRFSGNLSGFQKTCDCSETAIRHVTFEQQINSIAGLFKIRSGFDLYFHSETRRGKNGNSIFFSFFGGKPFYLLFGQTDLVLVASSVWG